MWTAARRAILLAWIGLVPILTGCAALSPLNGIPSNYFPDELRGETRSGKRTIDLSLLGQTPPDAHRLDSGDVLSIFIDGILGRRDQIPPVFMPKDTDGTAPSFGYPVAVQADGTIRLPLGAPIPVRGLTVPEAEEAIRQAVRGKEQLLSDANPLLLVSLQRARQYNVLVIRQEQTQIADVTGGVGQLKLGNAKRGTGKVVTLKAYENDVLHALAETGGLPGLDAENTIYVIRRRTPARPGAIGPNGPLGPLPAGPGPLGKQQIEVRGQSPDTEPRDGYSSSPIPWESLSPAEKYAVQYGGVAPAESQPGQSPPRPATLPRTGSYYSGHSLAGSVDDIPSPAPLTIAPPGLPDHVRPPLFATPTPLPAPQPWPAIANGDIRDAQGFLAQRRMDSEIITIPVRLADGEVPRISEPDIILYDGDIVFIESRETEVFYTGGLLGGNQFALPRDYDIDVVRAIAIASGSSTDTATGWSGRMGGVSVLNRDISVGASDVIVLRELPNGTQVPIKVDLNKALRDPRKYSVRILPGDYVLLQYKPHEAVAAFIERNLLAGGLIGVAATNATTGGGN